MRDGVQPISADERRGRIEKARSLLVANKIDAVMLTGGTSLVYFSGMQWGLSERLLAMVLPAKGDAFYVCPAFEEDRAREQIAKGPLGHSADVRTWEEHESPYERVAQGLRDRGIASGRLGIEETARRLGLTVGTLRTRLKMIFEKTGTHRQAELAHLRRNCWKDFRARACRRHDRPSGPGAEKPYGHALLDRA